jgi:hypothetical protein
MLAIIEIFATPSVPENYGEFFYTFPSYSRILQTASGNLPVLPGLTRFPPVKPAIGTGVSRRAALISKAGKMYLACDLRNRATCGDFPHIHCRKIRNSLIFLGKNVATIFRPVPESTFCVPSIFEEKSKKRFIIFSRSRVLSGPSPKLF